MSFGARPTISTPSTLAASRIHKIFEDLAIIEIAEDAKAANEFLYAPGVLGGSRRNLALAWSAPPHAGSTATICYDILHDYR